MPTKVSRTSDFPVGDQQGDIEKEDVIYAEFSCSNGGVFCKTERALMSRAQFLKLCKQTGFTPEWRGYEPILRKNDNGEYTEVIDAKTGKVKKDWKPISDPSVYSKNSRRLAD